MTAHQTKRKVPKTRTGTGTGTGTATGPGRCKNVARTAGAIENVGPRALPLWPPEDSFSMTLEDSPHYSGGHSLSMTVEDSLSMVREDSLSGGGTVPTGPHIPARPAAATTPAAPRDSSLPALALRWRRPCTG